METRHGLAEYMSVKCRLRRARTTRSILVASVAAVLLAALPAEVRAAPQVVLGATVAAAVVTQEKALTLGELPLAGQAAISAAIGSDDARFHAAKADAQVGGPDAYRLANSAHGFEAELTARGVQMCSGQARWGMKLSGYGYGEELLSVGAANPVADRNRVEYHRGALTEWYANGPQGLEQGFTIESPPAARAGGPLTIEVEFSGSLRADGDKEANTIALTDQGGNRAILRYSGLHAHDADGRDLGAWLEARGSRVLLRADDTNARYPVVVDPFVQSAKLTASDATDDTFGFSVAMSGDTVVVGAYLDDDQGSAYVFVKPGGGWATMTETAKLTASDGAASDLFGNRVAISGDTVVVGAHGDDIGANTEQGSAYVFVKPGGGWAIMTETAKLTASDPSVPMRVRHFGGFQLL